MPLFICTKVLHMCPFHFGCHHCVLSFQELLFNSFWLQLKHKLPYVDSIVSANANTLSIKDWTPKVAGSKTLWTPGFPNRRPHKHTSITVDLCQNNGVNNENIEISQLLPSFQRIKQFFLVMLFFNCWICSSHIMWCNYKLYQCIRIQ
jgi:hypothetical protein